MSGAKVLDFGSTSDFGNLDFPDLEKYLEQRLRKISSLTDLEKLISLINPFLRSDRFSHDEQACLKKLRQRAYDRKRNHKFKMPRSGATKSPKEIQTTTPSDLEFRSEQHSKSPVNVCGPVDKAVSKNLIDNSCDRIQCEPKENNHERFIKAAPELLAWLSASALVSYFLWQQSLSLYEATGFINAQYTAAGGILMIVGFAAYHSISRTILALMLCIYAGAYEGYLIVSGTMHDDKQEHLGTVESNPELLLLQEQVNKERAYYQDLKQRYDNPESKVFKNDWFMKNHVNPAWDASVKAHAQLAAMKSSLLNASSNEHVTWLKIFYRLGLVFLCMVLVHRAFAIMSYLRPAL